MRIVVTVKQVLDPELPAAMLRLEADRLLAPPGTAPVMNGYDANALEAALRLREANPGSTVTALSLGPTEARDTLRRALAMGADGGILVEEAAWCEARLVARALAAAVGRLSSEGSPVDLVLCGRQASDTDGGVVHFGIAEALGWSVVGPARGIEVGARGLRVERLTEVGHQIVESPLPAVVTVSSEVGEPRYPVIRGVMAASRAQIPAWTLASLGLGDEQRTLALPRLHREERASRVEMVGGESGAESGRRLVERLREERLI